MRRFKPRDVLRYTPVGGWHCRQGTAIVRGDGVAVDTYWGERGDGSESHRLTVEELADATLEFNVGGYDESGQVGHCAPRDEPEWLKYHPRDRQRIGSQGQCCARLYVKQGALPDLETQIGNARAEIEEAESDVRMAQSRLDRAREDLAKLEAQA